MIGRVLTLGLGPWGGKTLITLGYGIRAAVAPATRKHSGGDDEIDYSFEKKLKRRLRIQQEDDMLIRIVVSCVTEGLLG